ncbi:MAG: hypothetical protein A3A86_00855 [Elusimicrobia bacterium RIFCSPLOWO2_01_FULL_60_11]|nr:MAG: hypothetical protein A3A86_00855 [Elusimicrobia bacterium RIFCSPLOWO2_01_FULL_60_11]
MIYVCEADLKEGELRGRKVEGQWILIVKHQGGHYGLDAACAHSGYPLFKGGTVDSEGAVTCPLHYSKFDCRTGAVVSKPRICDDQIVFKVEVKEGKVYWIKNQ